MYIYFLYKWLFFGDGEDENVKKMFILWNDCIYCNDMINNMWFLFLGLWEESWRFIVNMSWFGIYLNLYNS